VSGTKVILAGSLSLRFELYAKDSVKIFKIKPTYFAVSLAMDAMVSLRVLQERIKSLCHGATRYMQTLFAFVQRKSLYWGVQ